METGFLQQGSYSLILLMRLASLILSLNQINARGLMGLHRVRSLNITNAASGSRPSFISSRTLQPELRVPGVLNVSWLDTAPLSVCQVSLRLQAAPRSGESAACVLAPRPFFSSSTRKLHFPCKPQPWGKGAGRTDRGQQDSAYLKA